MEYRHFSHREHALRFEYGDSYTCDGCREEGYGFRYRCRPCDFDMHESCARAPQSTRHFIDTQHDLVFKEKPGLAHVECDVCREKIEGFVYECRGCNIDLHPSCARLPHSLRHALHPHHMLQLVPSQSTGHGHGHVCNACGQGFNSREMRYCCKSSTPSDFILHISCAKLPVDPLEEMRMQSISPGVPLRCPAGPRVRRSSSTPEVPFRRPAVPQERRSLSTGRASTSSTGAAIFSSTVAPTQPISSGDVLRTGSALLSLTSSVLDIVNSVSDNN